MEVVASIVTFELAVGGDVSSFDESRQTSLKSSLRELLDCFEPDCGLELRISAGSVSVQAVLTIPDASPSGNATSTLAATQSLLSQPLASLSASLNVDVESASTVAMQTGVSVPIVVAPPPPSNPPSPSTPAPSASPAGSIVGAVAGALGGVCFVLVVLLCIGYRKYRQKQGAEKRGRAPGTDATRNANVPVTIQQRHQTAPEVMISVNL